LEQSQGPVVSFELAWELLAQLKAAEGEQDLAADVVSA